MKKLFIFFMAYALVTLCLWVSHAFSQVVENDVQRQIEKQILSEVTMKVVLETYKLSPSPRITMRFFNSVSFALTSDVQVRFLDGLLYKINLKKNTYTSPLKKNGDVIDLVAEFEGYSRKDTVEAMRKYFLLGLRTRDSLEYPRKE